MILVILKLEKSILVNYPIKLNNIKLEVVWIFKKEQFYMTIVLLVYEIFEREKSAELAVFEI